MTTALTLREIYSGTLAPIDRVKELLAAECDLGRVRDVQKAIEAARKLDGQNCQRRNYWASLSIFSARRLGELIREGQEAGTIAKRGQPKKEKSTDSTFLTLDDIGVSKFQSQRAQKILDVPEELLQEYLGNEDEEISQAGLIRFAKTGRADGDPHVSSNSGCNEWYTPPEYLKAARKVLGGIDLDPASSEVAQKNVKAKKYYSADNDGLMQPWKGRVWLNPPYSSDLVGKFTNKLAASYASGSVTAAVLLTNNATETQWFQFAWQQAAAVCFPAGRIRFLDESGEPKNSPLQGQAFLYFGKKPELFGAEFSALGICNPVRPFNVD